MVNKLIVDNLNITLNESTVLPFTYTFSMSGVHNVRIGLDNTDEICAYAFKDCENLTNVKNIPASITKIKRNAFENCVNLKKFNLPANIEYVGPNVFDGCISLSEIKFNNPTPPNFFTTLSTDTICYIPDGSKYVPVAEGEELVHDGKVEYYEKNILGGYDLIDFEALDDSGETQYYYDNWKNVHKHYNTIEERYRVKAEQIEFVDEGVPTTSFRDVQPGESFKIYDYKISPDNATNHNVYLFTNNPAVVTVDQEGNVTTVSELAGNALVKIFACTEPDYNGTYASTSLSFRVLGNKQEQPKVNPELSVSENTIEITDLNNVVLPTITKPEDAIVNYSSSNEEVATIDENGNVTLTGNNGEATITITVEADNKYNTATVEYSITVNIQSVEPEVPEEPTENTIDTEYTSDNEGNIQIINTDEPVENTIDSEYTSDNEGNIQVINTNE